MRAASRTASIRRFFSSSTFRFPPPPLPCPIPIPFSRPFLFLRRTPSSSLRRFSSTTTPPPPPPSSTFDFVSSPAPFIEKQFELPLRPKKLRRLQERIRPVLMEIEAAARIMRSTLLLVHEAVPIQEIFEKAKGQIEEIKGPFGRLAEVLEKFPRQHYRFHREWKFEMQTVVSLLAFVHWLETRSFLLHYEAEAKLKFDSREFVLDIEDYLIGLCFMSNVLPRFVVNQGTSVEYNYQREALKFLSDLRAAFRLLDLRNDVLRNKSDVHLMESYLRRVEEMDVKIRGLEFEDSLKGDGIRT